MLCMHSHFIVFLQLLHALSLQNILTYLPIGRQRSGLIGRIGGNKPIACLFSTAATCNGPVPDATNAFDLFDVI